MILYTLLLCFQVIGLSLASPTPNALFSRHATTLAPRDEPYWVGGVKHQGLVAFGNSTEYQIFRNVKEFGAKGDGTTDDTAAINKAISSGNRCGAGCDSSTVTPALVYFPSGTYRVSKPVVQYYYTQMIGDANNLPVIKGTKDFAGMALVDADPYEDDGSNWYTNQNNFFRSIRNFVIDLTDMPKGSGAGIHWQVGQATSLQNIRFEMAKGGGAANQQQGIFMDNGSGGFMSDLTFNGGNYGMFLGNQQFTTRNLTFNDCNTAVFVNWNWGWTFKSMEINNCQTGLNMSNAPTNQTVGAVLILDSVLKNTPTGVVTAWTQDSIPNGGGVLVLENVDFSGSKTAVSGIDGSSILEGGSVVNNFVQGNAYLGGAGGKEHHKRALAASGGEGEGEGETVTKTVVETVEFCPTNGIEKTLSGLESLPTMSDMPLPSVHLPSIAVSASGPEPTDAQPPASEPAGSATAPATSPAPVESSAQGSAPTPTTAGTSAAPSTTGNTHGSIGGHGHGHGHGHGQCSKQTVTKTRVQTVLPSQAKPSAILDKNGKVFERSKPLYENYPASAFVSVRSAGAKGDGKTDDTQAIQKILDGAKEDQVVFFDHGSYVVTDTIVVPKHVKIVGEVWPVLMAHGDKFSDEKKPIPMLQVGKAGEKGSVEISDITVQTKGPAPGAILMQWNLAEESQGSAGMWDTHFRIGGSAGTELQSDKCSKTPKKTTKADPECIGAFMLFHITEHASGYLENAWFWTADHELDLPDHNQINIYNGRGVLIESNGPVWLYGTASEHNQLYNYQLSNAKNVFMGMIQTETPYYQSNPDALKPFTPQTEEWNDPDFANCEDESCRKAWGLRVVNTSDSYVYGAGLYSFFENYSQDCLKDESCQTNMVEVDCSDIKIYGLSTKASVNMITSSSGEGLIPQDENESNYCSTIAFFEQA